jgi:hypothetical protein
LARPDESEYEEEVTELESTFLGAPKVLEAARKCAFQFDTENNIIVMCNRVESRLYRLRAQEGKKQKSLID